MEERAAANPRTAAAAGDACRLGPLTLRNRLVHLPHGVMFADRVARVPTPEHRDYYRSVARGGVSLVFCETTSIGPDGLTQSQTVDSSSPACIPGYTAIAEAVHAEGALLAGQIMHGGREAIGTGRILGPSAIAHTGFMPCNEMTRHDMDDVIAGYVRAAENLVSAGFDLVEVKSSHDGLLRHFLTPSMNDRRDEYGGSLENRARFPLEVISAVKEALPASVAFGVRLSLDQKIGGGYDLEAGLRLARLYEEHAPIDYISANLGVYSIGSAEYVVPPMGLHEGFSDESAMRLRAAIALPIITAGKIRDSAHIQRLLEAGVEFVGIARANLADPNYARNLLAGEEELTRPCVACNACLHAVERTSVVECPVNPSVGDDGGHVLATVGKRVVVVGGGPAGLETARRAALAGHEVHLFERDDRLGGRLRIAGAGGRHGWNDYLAWLLREVDRTDIELRIGDSGSVEEIRSLSPDHVIIACGSTAAEDMAAESGRIDVDDFLRLVERPSRLAFAEAGRAGPALWFSALDALQGGAEEVLLVTSGHEIGWDMDTATRSHLLGEYIQRGGKWLGGAMIDERVTAARPVGVPGDATDLDVDLLVVCSARVPAGNALAIELLELGFDVTQIGEAAQAVDVGGAVRDAGRVVRALSHRERPRQLERLN